MDTPKFLGEGDYTVGVVIGIIVAILVAAFIFLFGLPQAASEDYEDPTSLATTTTSGDEAGLEGWEVTEPSI